MNTLCGLYKYGYRWMDLLKYMTLIVPICADTFPQTRDILQGYIKLYHF